MRPGVFDSLFGRAQSRAAVSSSLQRIPATSPRRCPVRIRICSAGPNGEPSASISVHNALSSESSSTRSLGVSVVGVRTLSTGDDWTRSLSTAQPKNRFRCVRTRFARIGAGRSRTPSSSLWTSLRVISASRRPFHGTRISRRSNRSASRADFNGLTCLRMNCSRAVSTRSSAGVRAAAFLIRFSAAGSEPAAIWASALRAMSRRGLSSIPG